MAGIASDLKYRLRALLRRTAMDGELAAELQFHVDRHAAKLIAAGVPEDEARRRARMAIGGLEQAKEECRDARGVASFESLLQDVRYGLRQLRRTPGVALAVTLSLALGIGANTAIFTLIDAILLRSLPIADPGGLHQVIRHQPNGTTRGFEYNEFRRLETDGTVFGELASYGSVRLNVSIGGSMEPTAEGQLVSGRYFPLLGVTAIMGRTFGAEDDVTPNGHPVAVLSYRYWERRFERDPSVLGRTIHLSGTPFTVVGITPREFFGLEVGRAADIFVPVMMQPAVMPASESFLQPSILRATWLSVVGRLVPARTPEQARARLASLEVLNPLFTKPANRGDKPERIPERLDLRAASTGISALRDQFSQQLLILMAVVCLVLLIACANVANLVLARAASRTGEFSMRLALGASRWRLVRQLLVESFLLAAAGGLAGLFLARWATGLLVTFMSSGRTPIVLDLAPDLRILAFTAVVSIGTGVLCGVMPALRASRVDVVSQIKGHARGAMGGQWITTGKILVASQAALCLLLLFSAGLFARSLYALNHQDGDFNRDSVLIVRIEPRGSDQRGVPGTSQRLDTTYRSLLEGIAAIPGVRAASLAHFSPTTRVDFAGRIGLPGGQQVIVPRMMVYPAYFDAVNIPIRAGRDFTARDLAANAPRVAVVNEAFVRKVMNGENPVGRRVLDNRDRDECEIIGVVQDSRYASLREETPPLIYQPFLQTSTGRGQMSLHVRVADGASGVTSRVREEIQRIDRDMPLFAIQTLTSEMNGLLGRERLVAMLSGLFGVVALLLAAIGLYGVMAYSVVQRTGELGLRMALGAAKPAVVAMVLREAMVLVGIGLLVGVPSALATGRLASSQLSGLLYGLRATDPATLAGAASVLVIVAAIAALLPAMRAARVDPMVALRNE